MKKVSRHSCSLPLFTMLACLSFSCAAAEISPVPQQIETSSGDFKLDSSVMIALPRNASPNDEFLARSLRGAESHRDVKVDWIARAERGLLGPPLFQSYPTIWTVAVWRAQKRCASSRH